MDDVVVSNSFLKGIIQIPPSKSHTLRAIIYAMLAKGESVINNPLTSPDTQHALKIAQTIGSTYSQSENSIIISGVNGDLSSLQKKQHFFVGNSGILLRFITALGALGHQPVRIDGDAQIQQQRQLTDLSQGIRQLGGSVHFENRRGYAPLTVCGPVKLRYALIHGNDSQPVSALLLALAFSLEGGILEVRSPGETPWIDLSLSWFRRLNIPYTQQGYSSYEVPGSAKIDGFHFTVPGDFSSAAFPIVAALITNSELALTGLDFQDEQGDKHLITILREMGGDLEVRNGILHVEPSQLKGISIDVNLCIDALPILGVAACYAQGTTCLYNGAVARTKECDRIHSLAMELKKMGALIEETTDGLIIHGSPLQGAEVDSHGDHRMAMALIVAGFAATGSTTVKDIRCIEKTFPNFIPIFRKLGGNII
ncbi:MAG: 3-phosphoshikimate 1-carboxyvinyltransferase [Chlamydiales bacterium]